ncbi:GTP pyrophosphokinase family protein [Paenibacillus sp. GSMTC-2017]|uniref:GTP pyrophosphokinase n=1 Tax=Paenibacillus sp. GSMTC-2017 TaxID=2794350 RepID=UPI0018D9455C|nr:GTP pyrophosphokinase family protein [Paenibacillus sp. GSMTC-2017]MBH5320230.1 GTP pyrophosphokinase family protein [Paenibacillus sp. GSMTC-2017]
MNNNQIEQFKKMKTEVTRFMMMYQFALNELETKIEILKEEFQFLHDYNPIEHTKSRVKSLESIMKKIGRKGITFSLEDIKHNIKDIAGLRITCSFIADIYQIRDMLKNQFNLQINEMKDYIENPKPNGYRSLHLLVEVPVVMSDGRENVCVEIQIRTIAMDFWASLEHKIFYKYNQAVPSSLLLELKEASDSANKLDQQMERLNREITAIKENQEEDYGQELSQLLMNNQQFKLPASLMRFGNQTE